MTGAARIGGGRSRHDQRFDNNDADEEDDGQDWRHSDRGSRGKLAMVQQLRRDTEVARSRSSLSGGDYEDEGGDPPVEDGDDDNGDQSSKFRDHRGRIGDRNLRRQRQSFRFQPLTSSSIDEETSEDVNDSDTVVVHPQKHNHHAPENDEDDDTQSQEYFDHASHHQTDWAEHDHEEEGSDGSIDIGSFAVAADRKHQMSAVIHEYQRRKEEAAAATVIAHGFRRHKAFQQQRHHQRKLQRQQELNRQRWASQVITEALRRRIKRRHEVERAQTWLRAVLVVRKWVMRQQQKHRKRLEEAAVRVQRAFRQRQAYCRWKARVEMQQKALREMRKKQREAKQQEQLKFQHQQPLSKIKPTHEVVRSSRLEKDGSLVSSTKPDLITSLPSSHSPSTSPTREKLRKTVMKKEAVDLINGLVRQQLDETLRDRDNKVEELQRMVAALQDVVQKQNVMLTASNNQLLEFRRERDEAVVAARKPATQLPTIYTPSPPPKQSSRQQSSAATSPEMKQSMLPRFAPAKPPISGTPARSAAPTGLRPPRPIEFPTKLPVLVSGRGDVSPRLTKR